MSLIRKHTIRFGLVLTSFAGVIAACSADSPDAFDSTTTSAGPEVVHRVRLHDR